MNKNLILSRRVLATLMLIASQNARADMLPSSAFVSTSSFCREREYAAHIWLQSDHGKRRPGQQDLEEDNYGLGVKVTCDGWFYIHLDKLRNSQRGLTDLVMVGITQKWYPMEEYEFHFQASVGKVYLNYRVPRLGANAEGYASAGYLGIGYGPVTLQVAPVPKQDKVYIVFIQAKIPF